MQPNHPSMWEIFLPIIRRRGSSFVLYPSVDGNDGEEDEEGDSDGSDYLYLAR